MKISSGETARPHDLENAIQRVQANIDRRAARAKTDPAAGAHVPGANALAKLQANLQRKMGAEPQPTPSEPQPIAPITEPLDPDALTPAPAPAPVPTEPSPSIAPAPLNNTGGLDILA